MDLLYRVMGIVAGWSERGSRYRVNAIGSNWWALLFFGIFAGFATAQVIESLNNRGDASLLSLKSVLAGEGMVDRYVGVKGALDPEGILSKQDKKGSDKEPNEVWVPFVDDQDRKAIYVKFNLKDEKQDGPKDGALRGMLRKMDGDLRTYIAQHPYKSAGIGVDQRFVLVAGERPATLWVWIIVAAALWLVTAMIALAIAMRYVVFRRTSAASSKEIAPAPAAEDSPLLMLCSGVFVLNEKDRRRFLAAPGVIAEMASNDPAIITKIDASEHFMGNLTRNLNGIWALVMKAGTLSAPEMGEIYVGFKRRTAMRIRYVDAFNARRRSVVLSFTSAQDRETARALLYDPHPHVTPTATESHTEPSQAESPALDTPVDEQPNKPSLGITET